MIGHEDKQYNPGEVEDLVNGLDDDGIQTLMHVFNKIDRLQMDERSATPFWTNDEMDLIGQFQNLQPEADDEPTREDEEEVEEPDDIDKTFDRLHGGGSQPVDTPAV